MWLFQRLRSATSQQDDQQQHADSQLQSDSSVGNDKQAQVLANGLQNLAVSTKDEVIDRYILGQSVVINEEEQVKQAADEDHRHLVVKEAGNEASQAKSSSESEAKSHWDVKEALKVDTEEFRVSEERETGVRCEIRREEVEYEKVYEHEDSQLRSDYSVDNDKQAQFQFLAKGFQIIPLTVAVSTKDEVIDRYIQGQSVVIDEEEQVKQAADEDHRHLVVKVAGNEASQAKSSSESEAKSQWDVNKALKVDTEEFRVSEERQTGLRCEIPGKEVEYEKVYEHKDEDLKEKHEIEIEERVASSKIGNYENIGGDGREEGSVSVPDDGKSRILRPDCDYYTRTDCKFDHPLIDKNQHPIKETKNRIEESMERHGLKKSKPTMETKKKKEENVDMHGSVECKQPAKETKKKKENNVEGHGLIDCKPTKETKKKKVENAEKHGPVEFKPTKETKKKKEKNVNVHGPVEGKLAKETKEKNIERHGPPIKCKHPVEDTRKKNEKSLERHEPIGCKSTKETKKKKENNAERNGLIECKYHMSSAGCKLGKACKFNHGKGNNVRTPVIEYNFVGLPIRPGERECPYYMRNGSCQYGRTCRLHHPDPVAVEAGDPPTSKVNDGPCPIQTAPQPNIPNMPSWSPPRTPDSTSAFVPMMSSPPQNMPPPNPDWYGFQAPAHLYPSSEQGPPIPMTFFTNNPPSNKNMYARHLQPALVLEYPERLDQPDCRYFMKTGYCKYQASCKFRHPQNRFTQTTHDQNICTYFRRHGTCKYGSACKYDHPVTSSNTIPAGVGYDGSNGPDR